MAATLGSIGLSPVVRQCLFSATVDLVSDSTGAQYDENMNAPRPIGEVLTFEYLEASKREPVESVRQGDSLSLATTKMRINNFSQLPVLCSGKSKRPFGVVSWESIGEQLSLNPNADLEACTVKDPPKQKLSDELLPAISIINASGYVLVVNDQDHISGIVTTADLGEELANIARPLMLFNKIETDLRRIFNSLRASGKLTDETLNKALAGSAGRVAIGSRGEEYTLGDLVKVVTYGDVWDLIPQLYDRGEMTRQLNATSELRNKVMHFRALKDEHHLTLSRLEGIAVVMNDIANKLTD